MSSHSLETWDLELPVRPLGRTRSLTRRVETPPIQASWITATRACSLVLRGSGRDVRTPPQLRDAQLERTEPRVAATGAMAVAVVEPGLRALVTEAPMTLSTSASISSCSTASATARRRSPSSAFSSSSTRVLGHRVLRRFRVKRINSALVERFR